MDLFFLRHGEAEPVDPDYPEADFERVLTEKSMNDLILEAFGLKQLVDGLDVILTSPLTRAAQTASIFAKVFNCENKIHRTEFLQPPCTLPRLMEAIALKGRIRSVLCVGHAPSLGELATELITGIEEESFFKLEEGGLIHLRIDSPDPDQDADLINFYHPDVLKKIGENFNWDEFETDGKTQG